MVRRPCRPLRRRPWRRLFRQPLRKRPLIMFKPPSTHYGKTPEPETPYQKAVQIWDDRIGSARGPATNWRLAAVGRLLLAGGCAGGPVGQATRGTRGTWRVGTDAS